MGPHQFQNFRNFARRQVRIVYRSHATADEQKRLFRDVFPDAGTNRLADR
jgi:hypothetical protein